MLVPSSTSAPFASLSPEGRAPTPSLAWTRTARLGAQAPVSAAPRARAARHGPPVGPARDVPSSGRRLPRPQPRATIPSQTSPSAPRTLPRARPQAPPALAPTPTAVRASPGRPQPRAMRPLCRATRRRGGHRGDGSRVRDAREAGGRARVRFHARRRRRGVLRVVRMGDVPGDGSRPTAGHGRVRTRDHGGGGETHSGGGHRGGEDARRRGSEARGVARGAGRQRTDVLLEPNHGRDTLGPPVFVVHLSWLGWCVGGRTLRREV